MTGLVVSMFLKGLAIGEDKDLELINGSLSLSKLILLSMIALMLTSEVKFKSLIGFSRKSILDSIMSSFITDPSAVFKPIILLDESPKSPCASNSLGSIENAFAASVLGFL